MSKNSWSQAPKTYVVTKPIGRFGNHILSVIVGSESKAGAAAAQFRREMIERGELPRVKVSVQ